MIKDKILNQQWIEHYFGLSLLKPANKTHLEFLSYLEKLNKKILGFVIAPTLGIFDMGKNVSVASFKYNSLPKEYTRVLQFLNITEDTYFMLIRFIDQKESDRSAKEALTRSIMDNKRSYKFSPVQSQKILKICKSLEGILVAVTGVKQHELMTLITGIDEDVFIHEFDGLQYFAYPLSKRAELYKKHPTIDEELFGLNFPEFIRWILDKEKDSEDMKRNCDRVKKILLRIGISFSI